MVPRTNFQLARVFGIRIGVGISWFVVLFLFVIVFTPGFHEVLGGSETTAYLVAVAVVLSFFVSLILHELGHALVARRNGLSVAGIDLWAFGGLTRMRELPRTPGSQLQVAVAGPLVTLAVIVALRSRRRAGGAAADTSPKSATGGSSVHGDAGAGVAELGGDRQPVRARVQPDPRVPARRRADRPGADLVAHRRPQPRHALDGPRRAGRSRSCWAALGLVGLAARRLVRSVHDGARVHPLPGGQRRGGAGDRSGSASRASRSPTSWTASR